MNAVKDIRNPVYLGNGAVDCEVLFEGRSEYVVYTAAPGDAAPTGQRIWQELQSGKWGEIAPFTATPELIAAAKDAKRQEIEAWRTEQEAQSFTFEWNGRTWNAGPSSLARLTPAITAAEYAGEQAVTWSDTTNEPVNLTVQELKSLAVALAQALSERNNAIYRYQREMKEELDDLSDLQAVRNFCVGKRERPGSGIEQIDDDDRTN